MHILDKIVRAKRKEVELKKSIVPLAQLEASSLFARPANSLSGQLKMGKTGIIAEHKRRSPSKPLINNSLSVQQVVSGYHKAGVCGISVLTDNQFFGGSLDDLVLARAAVSIPLLRKEFIIDAYQILEAKAHGADVILLIASILKPEEIENLAKLARDLELEVLLEIHNEKELRKIEGVNVEMVGVNNRNLKTFEVSIETSKSLAELIPDDYIKVSESGLDDFRSITELEDYGYRGFLIGERFMKSEDPGKTAEAFINQLRP